MPPPVIIVGAGQAGSQAVASLRQAGFEGPVMLVGGETWPPYQRPPLSKKYLAGTFETERLFLRPAAFYAANAIETRFGVRAVSIDREARALVLQDGTRLAYDRLILATGTRARWLPIPGADLKGVHVLRGIDDADAMRADLKPGMAVAIAGAGYVGLEVASVLAAEGHAVTIYEIAERALARQSSPEISDFFQRLHAARGVSFRFATPITAIEGPGRVAAVNAGGTRAEADLVLIAAGAVPETALAEEAGLAVDGGIVVDAFGRTADPQIYAAGDCTAFPCAVMGAERLHLESVQNAIDQAKHVALAIAGRPEPYDCVPWFWSDQYEVKLQIAGIAAPGATRIVRGDPQAGRFAVFHLRDGVLVCVEAAGAAPEYMAGLKMIARHARPDPAALADPAHPMKAFL